VLERPVQAVDKELEKRGHAFVRYADDSNVYVRSERAGQRVRWRDRGTANSSATPSVCPRPRMQRSNDASPTRLWRQRKTGSGRASSANCVLGECPVTQPRLPQPMPNAGGGPLVTRRSISPCLLVNSIAWDFQGLPHDLNRPNRRMRTRTSGGVGGKQRGQTRRPLSRSS
jgi:hypothetical protein